MMRLMQEYGCTIPPALGSTMHEFEVLVTFAVIAAVYIGLFLAAEKYFMK
jgi:hypothetical protein